MDDMTDRGSRDRIGIPFAVTCSIIREPVALVPRIDLTSSGIVRPQLPCRDRRRKSVCRLPTTCEPNSFIRLP